MQIMVPSNRVNISPNHILRQNFSAKKNKIYTKSRLVELQTAGVK